MSDEPTVPTPGPIARSVLWLASRSTFETGTQYCAFRRYIENHAGPFGYGMQRKALSVPLATGTYIHLGLQLVCQWILDARLSTGIQPTSAPDEVIRWAANESVQEYQRVVAKRGILTLYAEDPDTIARLKLLIQEQSFLIEGLIWSWCLGRLPAYLAEYCIVAVEEEESYVRGCTCGIGDGLGEIADHELRGCSGIGLLSQPDLLGERWSDHLYGYAEFKTTSVAKREWNNSWERKQQFLLGILGAERRHGVEISHATVEGLIKGQRKRDYPYGAELPKKQQSPLVYAYFAPGTIGVDARWRPKYEYYDREGVKFTCSRKDFKKVALWDPPEAWPSLPEGVSISEYWVKVLQADYPHHLQEQYSLIGPLPKQRAMIDKALRALEAEELVWQDRLWRIYEFAQKTGKEWGDDQFMAHVETVVPRSWNCDPFGIDHPCPHQVVCHPVTDDWRQPIASGLYVFRTPHHAAEEQQMKDRGLQPEHGLAEEDDEAESGGD